VKTLPDQPVKEFLVNSPVDTVRTEFSRSQPLYPLHRFQFLPRQDFIGEKAGKAASFTSSI
jgi:hypothetical protein